MCNRRLDVFSLCLLACKWQWRGLLQSYRRSAAGFDLTPQHWAHSTAPSPLRDKRSASTVGPLAPASDWFFNKEWTALPGTLGNCHICHPPPEASCECEQLLCSNWTELSDGEQQQGSSERRWSISAPNDNEESLRGTLGASQTCINCTLRTHSHIECIMLILVPICQPRFMAKAGL